MSIDRYALIDGDISLYRALFGAEESTLFPSGEEPGEQLQLTCNIDKAWANLNGFVQDMAEIAKADPIFVISDAENFRKDLCPTYKQARATTRKPIGLAHLKELAEDRLTCLTKPRMEADDVLGILATGDMLKGKKLVISSDKDLLCVPGFHYDPSKKEQGVVPINEEEACWHHMMQTLTGDVVDSYPGCPGLGPVRAAKVLAEAESKDYEAYWPLVLAAFEKAKQSADEALLQARLARILRAEDYDFKSKEIILWTP